MSVRQSLLFLLGRPLAPIYSWFMTSRAARYGDGRRKVYRLPVPVVSVGNLTWGGTGKTPIIMYLAEVARQAGWKPAVISRGYRGKANDRVNVVSDGDRVLLDVAMAGDEPLLLAQSLPGVPVLTGVDRVRVGSYAVERYGVDLVLLDDGFQHLRLARDLDIVLFAAGAPLGNGRVFPAGPLREPVAALARAHCFVFTGQGDFGPVARQLRRRFAAIPQFQAGYQDAAMVTAEGQDPVSSADMAQRPVYLFCGLGSPSSFRATVEAAGITVHHFSAFADHYRYRAADVAHFDRWLAAHPRGVLLTSAKDAVKIGPLLAGRPLYVLRADLIPDREFTTFFQAWLATRARKAIGPFADR